MKKRSALIFGLLAAALALGMAVTGCSSGGGGGDDDGGGGPAWPVAWTWRGLSSLSEWAADENDFVKFYAGGTYGELALVRIETSDDGGGPANYKLETFTGDGSGTGSFTMKEWDTSELATTGSTITGTMSMSPRLMGILLR